MNAIVILDTLFTFWSEFIFEGGVVEMEMHTAATERKRDARRPCRNTPSTLSANWLPCGTDTGSPRTRGWGDTDNLMLVVCRVWKKYRGIGNLIVPPASSITCDIKQLTLKWLIAPVLQSLPTQDGAKRRNSTQQRANCRISTESPKWKFTESFCCWYIVIPGPPLTRSTLFASKRHISCNLRKMNQGK